MQLHRDRVGAARLLAGEEVGAIAPGLRQVK
jgi:hypothetical protein